MFNPLSASISKWSNTLKQFVGKLPTNCLSVFVHFVGLVLKGLNIKSSKGKFILKMFRHVLHSDKHSPKICLRIFPGISRKKIYLYNSYVWYVSKINNFHTHRSHMWGYFTWLYQKRCTGSVGFHCVKYRNFT